MAPELWDQYSHVGQGCTEVFVNISLKHSVEMLELDVSNQRNNKYLPKNPEGNRSTELHTNLNRTVPNSIYFAGL